MLGTSLPTSDSKKLRECNSNQDLKPCCRFDDFQTGSEFADSGNMLGQPSQQYCRHLDRQAVDPDQRLLRRHEHDDTLARILHVPEKDDKYTVHFR